jgi:hypothetical protein
MDRSGVKGKSFEQIMRAAGATTFQAPPPIGRRMTGMGRFQPFRFYSAAR